MQEGTITAYSPAVSAGVIKGKDGRSYKFSFANWLSPDVQPANNQKVVFEKNRNQAMKVKAL